MGLRVHALQERKAVESWLDAASKSMDAAKEPLNAFHWDTRRLMTNDDLIAQLRSAAISREIQQRCKPHLEQVSCTVLAGGMLRFETRALCQYDVWSVSEHERRDAAMIRNTL